MNFFFSSRRRHTFFFQAEDGIRDRSPSRGLGDVYKRQIAATAVSMPGKESEIFKKVLPWSVGMLLALCLLVFLQSNVLAWMLPVQ